MSDPTNISLTLSQVGREIGAVPNDWTNETLPFSWTIPATASIPQSLGFVFTHPNYNYVDGYDLQTPRLFTDTDRQAVVTIVASEPFGAHGLYVFGLSATELWSSTNMPAETADLPDLSNDMYLVRLIELTDWVLSGGLYTLTLNVDFSTAYQAVQTFDGSGVTPIYYVDRTATLAHLMASTTWTGRIGLAIVRNLNSILFVPIVTTISSVTMTSWQLDWWTGEAGGRANTSKRVRVARDSRYGMPAYSSDLIEDDYRPGVWVRPTDWDPEDPQPEYIGSPSEGETDDVPVK